MTKTDEEIARLESELAAARRELEHCSACPTCTRVRRDIAADQAEDAFRAITTDDERVAMLRATPSDKLRQRMLCSCGAAGIVGVFRAADARLKAQILGILEPPAKVVLWFALVPESDLPIVDALSWKPRLGPDGKRLYGRRESRTQRCHLTEAQAKIARTEGLPVKAHHVDAPNMGGGIVDIYAGTPLPPDHGQLVLDRTLIDALITIDPEFRALVESGELIRRELSVDERRAYAMQEWRETNEPADALWQRGRKTAQGELRPINPTATKAVEKIAEATS